MTQKRNVSASSAPHNARAKARLAADAGETSDEKVTVSLSISRDLLEQLDKRWRNLPGLNRSAYFEILAQNDLKTGGAFTIFEKNRRDSNAA